MSDVHAKRRSKKTAELPPVPDLEQVLQRAGWSITPEMSAAYSQPGDIFDESNSLIKKGEDCFEAKVHEGAYASMEVNRSLESGVRIKVAIASGGGGVGLTKKLVFDTPTHRQIARLDLVPTEACHRALLAARDRGMPIDSWIVVTEALSAVVQKQECGEYNAKGGFFMVSADATVQQACAQTSLDPVAVAYKTVQLTTILPTQPPAPEEAVVLSPPPTVVGPGLIGEVQDVVSTAQPAAVEEDPMLAELRALQARESDLAAQRRDTELRLQDAKQELLTRATQTWAVLEELLASNPEVALSKLQQFISRYSSATVSMDGPDGVISHPVSVPEVAMAQASLDALSRPKRAQADPVLMFHDIEMVAIAVSSEVGPPNATLYVSDVEVGQALYEAVMGQNPSFFWACGPTCPVERVSWYDAVEFCNRLSEREGVDPAYTISGTQVSVKRKSQGYRLLTAAEWTAAAQAGTDFSYPGSDSARQVAWTKLNSDKKTHPARELRSNTFKLWDLGGNVAEWVWDSQGRDRQTKGGSWSSPATSAQSVMTTPESPSFRGKHIGFRLARSISEGAGSR